MKKKKDNASVDLTSILETNSAHVDESLLESDKVKLTGNDRKRLISILILTGILVLLVAAVLVVGILVGQHHQARLEAESARDDVLYSYDSFESKPGTLWLGLSQAYYSKENGMQLVLVFGNETNTVQKISGVNLTILNDANQVVAKGGYSQNKTWITVGAGEEAVQELYFKPEYVFIQNEPLQDTNLRIEYDIFSE